MFKYSEFTDDCIVYYSRVRNSANTCVRDMPKYLRTSRMSVHGYPADMSIFLQLGLLKLQEDTPQADIDQDNVSLAGVLQDAVGRAVWYPPPRQCSRCVYWAIIRRFLRRDTIAGGTGTQSGRVVFQILQRLVDADFAAVEIGFYAQCWSCFSELDVGWSEPLLFIFNRQNELCEWAQTGSALIKIVIQSGPPGLELTSHCLTSDWQLKHCETFGSVAYIFKGHLNNIRKWLFIFENIIERFINTMLINYNLFQMHTFGTQFFCQQGPHF